FHANFRIIDVLQPFINYAFAVTYYCTMALVAILVYVLIRDGSITNALLSASTAMSYVLECYWWCYLIDSLQVQVSFFCLVCGMSDQLLKFEILQAVGIADLVNGVIFELSRLAENHSEYVQMRTSLMIIQIYASTNSEWFSCAGVFPVSIEAFKNLCNIIYSLITFLLNMQ
ncbi:uncharacterized protein LOC134284252, partial [Aedes albopictus]|uniref:Odorant receptor n=1 Tax=Aedes albopictus TaxID=7160 RepID=A0ABM1Z623_AEDAL